MTSAVRRGVFWGVAAALAAALCLSAHAFTRRALPPGEGSNALIAGLGGSRGILAEILWFRMHQLQREGRYAELALLTDTLLDLDPANIEAWIYIAWDQAYNISYEHTDLNERWRWIRSAQALLDRGLAANPGNPDLLFQYGWIWEHKVGGERAEAPPHDYPEENRHYRARLAELPPPEDAAAFAALLGTEPDWGEPSLRAFRCYVLAERFPHALRALERYILERAPAERPALFACFHRTFLAAEPELTYDHLRGYAADARALLGLHPGDPHLQAIIRHAHTILTQENAP